MRNAAIIGLTGSLLLASGLAQAAADDKMFAIGGSLYWIDVDATNVITMDFTGGAIVMARDLKIGQEGFEQTMSFRLPADTDVTVVLTAPVGSAPVAVLREVFPGGLRAPAWELFTPLAPTR